MYLNIFIILICNLEYFKYVQKKMDESGQHWRLLIASFFIDGFLQYHTRKKEAIGIYMIPKNLPLKVI